jgi:ribosome biogenesis protein MAK21
MIIHKPEQEQRLLGMIINKLGDHVGGACSKASDLLKNLLYKHPAMKAVVVKEVRQFIHRPNLNPKALYNGIIFLNQVQLTSYDTEVAEALIETYIGLFEKAVSQNDLSSKQLGALLNGINRSYPFLKDKMVLEKHVDVLFKVVHVATFAASTQALVLISLIVLGDEIEEKRGKGNKKTKKPVTTSTSDISTESGRLVDGKDLTSRFYRALYEKLNSEQVVRILRIHESMSGFVIT